VAVTGSTDFTSLGSQAMRNLSLSIDRGMHNTVLANKIASKGGVISGTVKKSRNANRPFIEYPSMEASEKSKLSGKFPNAMFHISESGARAAYWVQERYPSDKNRATFFLAFRNGHNKIVYLSTMDPSLGPEHWVLERADTNPNPFHVVYNHEDAAPEESKIESSTLQESKEEPDMDIFKILNGRSILRMTSGQNDHLWFLLRMFRITSHVAYNMIKNLYLLESISHHRDIISDLNTLRNILHFRGHPPLVECELRNLTIAELVQVCRNRAIAGYSAYQHKGKEELINYILEISSKQASLSELNKAFLSAWFLQPHKSTKAMSTGSANEGKVIAGLHDFLLENTDMLVVKEVVRVGLLIDRNRQHMGTSADGLLRAEVRHQSLESAASNQFNQLLAVEVKTRSSTTTLNLADALAGEHGKFVICAAENHELFATLIPQGFERGQILHHIVTLGIEAGIYAEASTAGIIRCVMVVVSPAIRDAYRRVLDHINSHYFSWIQNETVLRRYAYASAKSNSMESMHKVILWFSK